MCAALSPAAIAAPASAPPTVANRPSISDSSRNIHSTSRRCMPMARSVPISRVRSRMAIHIVFMMPMTMIAIRMTISTTDSPCSAFSVQVMNEISSSQLVTSSFCPVQSSRSTDSNFIQNARGSALHHPVARLSPAPGAGAPAIAGMSSRSLRSSMIWMTPVASWLSW